MNRFFALLAAAAALVTLPAFAHDGVHINDAYARVMGGVGASVVFTNTLGFLTENI